jgi:hypothetical protein
MAACDCLPDYLMLQEMVAFRLHQWQVCRVLLLRRYAAVTGCPEHAQMTHPNLTAALKAFDLPSTPAQLLSRPFKYHNVQEAAGSKMHGKRSSEDFSTEAYLQHIDRCDITHPSEDLVTAAEIAAIDSLDLSDRSLGHDPSHRPDHASAVASQTAAMVLSSNANAHHHATDAYKGGALHTFHGISASSPAHADMNAMAAIAADLVSNRRHKTKLCHAFQRGHCPRGERCDYAHGEHELRIMHVRAATHCTYQASTRARSFS